MLKLGCLYWSTADKKKLLDLFSQLNFEISPSPRETGSCVFFGPSTIELVDRTESLLGAGGLTSQNQGLVGVGFESEDVVSEYKRMKEHIDLPQPKKAVALDDVKLQWAGYEIPPSATAPVSSWVYMNSNDLMSHWKSLVLPRKHGNGIFGFESLALFVEDVNETVTRFESVMGRKASGIKVQDPDKMEGHRFLAGEGFLDFFKGQPQRKGSILTLKSVDLEVSKAIFKKAGLTPVPCKARDGFSVAAFDNVTIKVVRAAWKRFLPQVSDYFPYSRKMDSFRALGGANSTTLRQGFEAHWNYFSK